MKTTLELSVGDMLAAIEIGLKVMGHIPEGAWNVRVINIFSQDRPHEYQTGRACTVEFYPTKEDADRHRDD